MVSLLLKQYKTQSDVFLIGKENVYVNEESNMQNCVCRHGITPMIKISINMW